MINLHLAPNTERNPGPGRKSQGEKEKEKLVQQEPTEEGFQVGVSG